MVGLMMLVLLGRRARVFTSDDCLQNGPPHPLFVKMYTRASYALLMLTCVQWPSFLLTAFFFYGDPGMFAFVF